MIEVPVAIEDALREAAAAHIEERFRRGAALQRAIVRRSHLYTSEREQLGEADGGPADLAARALFFSVADAAKVFVPLAELAHRGVLPARRPLRLVDIGAGAGAMTLGVLAFLAERGVRRIQVRALDRDRAALELLRSAVQAFAAGAELEVTVVVEHADLRAAPSLDRSDLIVAGTVLNELGATVAMPLIRAALNALEADGALLVIEPALRETSRALHRLRDDVLEEGLARVFAPCTRTIAPCPALADPDDWCHEDRPVQLPPLTSRLVTQTNLRQHGLKLAYLVLRHGSEGLVEAPNALRLVSRPRKLKGRLECFVCGQDGRERMRVLKRDKAVYRAMTRARRGDVLLQSDDGLEPTRIS